MTLYYQDPQDPSNFIPIKSRTLSGEHIIARDIDALPGTVEGDIGASKGFLATLAAAVSANRMAVDLTAAVTGYLATLAGAVLAGSMKTVLQAGTAAIGKLAANAGINIGTVDVASGSVALTGALPAGANAIGKLAANAGVNIGEVSTAAPSAASTANVNASATVVTILAANAARVGAMIYNSSTTGTLYVKLGSAASLTSWSVQLDPGGYWEMPRRYYTGIITGIWTVASGDAKVTETA